MDTNQEEDIFHGVDKKLGDLMLRGWTLLQDSCPLKSCNCPLMKSPDGQKYCVNCEMWQFDNKKAEKKKFTDLVRLQGKKDLNVKNMKNTELVESKKLNNIPPNVDSIKAVDELLNDKLKVLAERICEEKDLKKIEEISKIMEIIMSLIEHYKKIYSS